MSDKSSVTEATMGLREFPLRNDDGTPVAQTVVAEGASEAETAASAATLIEGRSDCVLLRPGVAAAAEVEARWREILEGTLPNVVPDSGRFARYARGQPRSGTPRRRLFSFSWIGLGRRKTSEMGCPQCGREMDLIEKDTTSGSDMRTYRCRRCNEDHLVDFGVATWKALSDAREAKD